MSCLRLWNKGNPLAAFWIVFDERVPVLFVSFGLAYSGLVFVFFVFSGGGFICLPS